MKKCYGSKKQKRHAEYLERKFKRDTEKKRIENYNKVMREGNIEQMAAVMGIPLK
jgi:hypothetical protein